DRRVSRELCGRSRGHRVLHKRHRRRVPHGRRDGKLATAPRLVRRVEGMRLKDRNAPLQGRQCVMRTLTMVVSAELNNMKKLIISMMVSAAVAHANNTDSFIAKIGGQGSGKLGVVANDGRGPTNAQSLAAVNYYISRVFKDPHSVQDLRLVNVF